MKKILALLLIILMAQGAWAQVKFDVPLPKSLRTVNSKNNPDRKVKFQTGGNIGVQIGTIMGLEAQPKFALVPIEYLAVGVTATYVLRWDVLWKEVSNTFGVSPFVEGYLFKKQLILHAEYEFVNFPVFQYDNYGNEIGKYRSSSHVVLVGAGYRKELSDRSSISTVILLPVYQYNPDGVNYYGAWYTPIVRIGYNYLF
ncbi:MAG: hypothetical protein J5644_01160 [Bacteroidales bacterium]|nr:hypothetical protein [Bacteroidales bacterium]